MNKEENIIKYPIYEIFPDKYAKDIDSPIFAIISYNVVNPFNSKNSIYILYLLDLRTAKFISMNISLNKHKSKDVNKMLNNCSNLFEQNTVLLTLNLTPFNTTKVKEVLDILNVRHVFYNKQHITPIIDFSKNYLNAMINVLLLSNLEFNLDNKKHIIDN